MPVGAIVAGTLIQGAKSLYDWVDAAKKDKKAAEIYRTVKRPVYNRAGEIDEIANLANSEIQNTTLADSYANQAQLGLSQGIDAVLKSGGQADYSTISGAYGRDLERALSQLSRDRGIKIASANNANYAVAKAKDTEFQYNVDGPYKDAMQLAATLKGQAAKGRADAFTNAAGAVANLGTSLLKPGQDGVRTATGGANQVGRIAGDLPLATITPTFTAPDVMSAPTQPGSAYNPQDYWDNYWGDKTNFEGQ